MKLRAKILMIIAAVLAAFLAITMIASNTILMGSFLDLENDDAARNAERVSNAIYAEINALDVFAHDWASWDDTYAFVEDLNENYTAANLVDSTFTGAGLCLMLIVNDSNGIVFGSAFDIENEVRLPIPPDIEGLIENGEIVAGEENASGGIYGILLTENGPVVISSRKILTSADEGPSRGSLIMARSMDDAFIERLGDTTQLSLSMLSANDLEVEYDFQSALQNMDNDNIFIERSGKTSLSVYAAEEDIYGNPAVIIRADISRTIYNQGQTTIIFSSILIVSACAILGLMMFVLLQTSVIGRLSSLGDDLDRIGDEGGLSARVNTNGNDELTLLGGNINKMLSNLERSQAIIVEEQERSQRMESEMQAIKHISEMKDQFIALATHELHIPITAMKGYTEILLSGSGKTGEMSEVARGLLEIIAKNTNRLMHLVDKMLDVQMMGTGTIRIEKKVLSLRSTLEKCARSVNGAIRDKNQIFEVFIGKSDMAVKGDEKRLEMAFSALLDNASKFTPKGGKITLSASDVKSDIIIEIKDTGIGISKEDLERVFDPFANIKKPDYFKGTGLSLSIAKGIVAAHGGKIIAESEGEGRGAKFTVILPTEKTR